MSVIPKNLLNMFLSFPTNIKKFFCSDLISHHSTIQITSVTQIQAGNQRSFWSCFGKDFHLQGIQVSPQPSRLIGDNFVTLSLLTHSLFLCSQEQSLVWSCAQCTHRSMYKLVISQCAGSSVYWPLVGDNTVLCTL